MENKEINLKTNYKIVIIGINELNPKIEKYNQDLNGFFSNNKKYPKYDSIKSNNINENNKLILDEKNKTNCVSNKLIQTPSNFYSFDNIIKFRNKCLTFNRKNKNNKTHKTYKQLEKNQNINSFLPGNRSAYFSKAFNNKYGNIRDIKYSRNKLYPIIYKHKNKTSEMKTYFKKFNILKEYFNNIKNKPKINHHNLFTIENIYFQGRNSNNNYNINDIAFEHNEKINKDLFKKKYSIKEIKYPYKKIGRNQYNIFNENNDHLLEEIYKKQTLSNFNNKYTLKYKTNNSVKKENIKALFSLLKKYKYSDNDKKIAFNKYNSTKKISKFIIC